jgi:DNA mismatch repair protein MutS
LTFRSILFDRADVDLAGAESAPEFFHDLHLDGIVESVTAGRKEYDLAPFFHCPLGELATVRYRHEVFRDLESKALALRIASFAANMRNVRESLAQSDKLHHEYQKQRCFLDAAALYCGGVERLVSDLSAADLRSRGLGEFREYIASYALSEPFETLRSETRQLQASLAAICYSLHIEGDRIEIDRYRSEPDYSAAVSRTFEKFKQGTTRTYPFTFHDRAEMNHVEAAILERVVLLYPEVFAPLAEFCRRREDWPDPVVRTFDREIQFYLAYLEHKERLGPAGLTFCYPEVTNGSKEIFGEDVFDLALAGELAGDRGRVVTNDFSLAGPERILVVSGANQGGKTTFARAFGQLHYLARLGCPVPARAARLLLFDKLFTHFEREESVETLTGKLEEELLRMRRILDEATPSSILLMNESFGSTTLSDALFLGREVLERIIERDMLGVCVTFLDELASLGPATVSMVSTVDAADPAIRTFKIIRKPANGLAHALAIARKYRLSYDDLKERLAS